MPRQPVAEPTGSAVGGDSAVRLGKTSLRGVACAGEETCQHRRYQSCLRYSHNGPPETAYRCKLCGRTPGVLSLSSTLAIDLALVEVLRYARWRRAGLAAVLGAETG